MSPDVIVILVLSLLFLLLASSVPVALALATSGTVGIVLLRGIDSATAALAAVPYQATARFTLVVIPMFILMGVFATRAGLAADVYAASHKVLKKLPGGLALASIAACAGFAAVSGSSNAMVATMGPVVVNEMRRYHYSEGFAAGVVAAAGTLGILIPPSITLVLYGIITGESIGAVLLAGIIPGFLSAFVYMIAVILYGRRYPDLVGGRGSIKVEEVIVDRRTYFGLGKVMLLFLIVIGGIYTGVFTATEAAALGALASLLILLTDFQKHGFKGLIKLMRSGLAESASISSFLFIIIVGASIFTFFLVSAGVPTVFAEWVISLDIPPLLVVGLLLLSMVPLGMFLDPISIMLVVLPLAYPVVVELGFSGVWFGIMVIKAIEIGLITPPVGLNVFIVAGTTGVSAERTFKGILWFLPLDAAVLAILFFFPGFSTWLPTLLTGR